MFSPIANTFLEFQKKFSENNNYIVTYLASNNGNYTEERFDKTISNVELVEVVSKIKPNTQGGVGEWGYNKSKLWVNRGLRANFRVTFQEKTENINELKNKVTALEKRILELEKPTQVEPNVESKYSSELTEEKKAKLKEMFDDYKIPLPIALLAMRECNWNIQDAISVIHIPDFSKRYEKELEIVRKDTYRRNMFWRQLNTDSEFKQLTVSELDKLWQQEQKENTAEIICFCGKPAVHLRVVSETRNKNRAYCSCKTRSCQFFSWKEGPVAQQFPHSNNIPYNPYN